MAAVATMSSTRPPRITITVAWKGSEPLPLPRFAVWPTALTLLPGDNDLPMVVWRALGEDTDLVNLIASGALAAVCREHRFQRDERTGGCTNCGGAVHPRMEVHCLHCGHSEASAAASEAEAAQAGA